MIGTKVVIHGDENIVKAIVSNNQGSFPSGWEYADAAKYYAELFEKKNSINIILKDNEKIIGHLLAIPHNDAVDELKTDDPAMRKDASGYYIETVAILPGHRGKKGLSAMLETLKDELKKRGINNISLHARVSNDFTKIIQKKMKVTNIRRIDKWKYYNYEEPTDYIEAAFK